MQIWYGNLSERDHKTWTYLHSSLAAVPFITNTREELHHKMNKSHTDKRLNQLPSWLWANSTTLPPIYRTVWEAVREDKIKANGMQTELLVDTSKVFPLLLTSQLSTDILGHIWSIANQKYAGQLTEQELYIVLALVAAAQASYTFNSLDILHLLPFPPTPYLNIECIVNVQSTVHSNSIMKVQHFSNIESNIGFVGADARFNCDMKGKNKSSSAGIIPSESNLTLANAMTGRMPWAESKAHVASPAVWEYNNVFRDIKQTAVRNHDFDVKQISVSATDPSDDFAEFQSAPVPSIPSVPIWDTKQGSAIGSRLANHNLGVKKPAEKARKNGITAKSTHVNAQARTSLVSPNVSTQIKDQPNMDCLVELFPKCSMKNQSKTVILKDTAIRNNDPPKDRNDNLKEQPAVTVDIANTNNNKIIQNTSTYVKISNIEDSQTQQKDLMNLQLVEDKYSALRALIEETASPSGTDSGSIDAVTSIDEFGEFVSAQHPIETSSDAVDTNNVNDIFTEFEFSKACNTADNGPTDLKLMSEISESFDNLKIEDILDERPTMDEKFELTVEAGKSAPKEDAISVNSIELISGMPGALTRSGSVPSLDLKSFLPTSAEDEPTIETVNQAIYWEWKQYMESCVLLLQVAANIFTNITSEHVLNEVLNSATGYSFLCNLAEVAAVCRRVNFSYKEMDINIMGFDDLLMDIDRIWAEMEPFYANIPIVTELPAWPLHQGECTFCSLCLTVITSGRVMYNENNYHVTCANLWLNCVSNHLPAMRYPAFYSHLGVCTGNSHI